MQANDPGHFDHYLRFDRRQAAQEQAFGTEQVTWVPVFNVWASVEDSAASDGESAAHGIRIASRVSTISFRWQSGVTSDMRIVDLSEGSRTMKILTPAVPLGGLRDRLQLVAADFTTQGDAA